MNDMAPDAAIPAEPVDIPNPIAATAPLAPEPPLTVEQSIAKATEKVLAEDKPEPKEPEPKAELEPKPEAKTAKPEPEKPAVEKPPVAEKQVNAPARLLPKERDAWPNTPRVVQSAIERMEREHDAERQTMKAATDLHAELREYDDMAKGAKTSIKEALDRYVNFDKVLSKDFGQGMAMIAKDQGKQPVEAVASLLRALGTTPEQYAQHVIANPQAHQIAPQQQERQAATDPVMARLDQMEQRFQERDTQSARDRVHAEIVAPFMATAPRFEELAPAIEKLLKSDIVPQSLSAAERLETAYDMAERLNPSSVTRQTASDPDRDAPSFAGKKSISGAPGTNSTKARPRILSVADTIAAEARRMGVA